MSMRRCPGASPRCSTPTGGGREVITRVGILDELTPAVAAGEQDWNPAAGRALLRWGRLMRRQAVRNVNAMFQRTGRNRTLTGVRGIKVRQDQAGGIRTGRIPHRAGT